MHPSRPAPPWPWPPWRRGPHRRRLRPSDVAVGRLRLRAPRPRRPAHDTAALSAGADWLGSQVTEGRRAQRPVRLRRLRPRASTSPSPCTRWASSRPPCRRSATGWPRTSTATPPPGFGTVDLRRRHRQGGRAGRGRRRRPDVVRRHGPGRPARADRGRPRPGGGPDPGRARPAGGERRRLRERGRPGVRRPGARPRPAAPRPAAATTFLLAQQCRGGWFRLGFTAGPAGAGPGLRRATASSKPDLDATAFAVQALERRRLGAGRPRRVDRAVAWLEKQQAEGRLVRRRPPPGRRTPTAPAWPAPPWPGPATPAAAEQAATWVRRTRRSTAGSSGPAVRGRHRLRRRRPGGRREQGHHRQGRGPVPPGERRRAAGAAVAPGRRATADQPAGSC